MIIDQVWYFTQVSMTTTVTCYQDEDLSCKIIFTQVGKWLGLNILHLFLILVSSEEHAVGSEETQCLALCLQSPAKMLLLDTKTPV